MPTAGTRAGSRCMGSESGIGEKRDVGHGDR